MDNHRNGNPSRKTLGVALALAMTGAAFSAQASNNILPLAQYGGTMVYGMAATPGALQVQGWNPDLHGYGIEQRLANNLQLGLWSLRQQEDGDLRFGTYERRLEIAQLRSPALEFAIQRLIPRHDGIDTSYVAMIDDYLQLVRSSLRPARGESLRGGLRLTGAEKPGQWWAHYEQARFEGMDRNRQGLRFEYRRQQGNLSLSFWAGARRDEFAATHGEAGLNLQWRPGAAKERRSRLARGLLPDGFTASAAALLRDVRHTESTTDTVSGALYLRPSQIRGREQKNRVAITNAMVHYIGIASGSTIDQPSDAVATVSLSSNFSTITTDIGTPGPDGTPGTTGASGITVDSTTGNVELADDHVYVVTSNLAHLGKVTLGRGTQLVGIGGYLPVYTADDRRYLWRAGATPQLTTGSRTTTEKTQQQLREEFSHARLSARKIVMGKFSGIHSLELYSTRGPASAQREIHGRAAFIRVKAFQTVHMSRLRIRAANYGRAIRVSHKATLLRGEDVYFNRVSPSLVMGKTGNAEHMAEVVRGTFGTGRVAPRRNTIHTKTGSRRVVNGDFLAIKDAPE